MDIPCRGIEGNILALTGLQFQREGVPYPLITFTFKCRLKSCWRCQETGFELCRKENKPQGWNKALHHAKGHTMLIRRDRLQYF